MAAKNEDLHGNEPDKASVALLLIDVINDFEFPEGDQLLHHAQPMARQIAALKARAKREGIPAIYVNDHIERPGPATPRRAAKTPGCAGRYPARGPGDGC
jgi:nicotinamidase-related amidase